MVHKGSATGLIQSYTAKKQANKDGNNRLGKKGVFNDDDLYYQALKEQNPDSFDGDHCTSKSLTAVLMSRMNQFDNTVDTQVLEQTDLADENKPYDGETIVVNGVERPTKNSDEQPIAKSEPALRNFWNWFGDSKVVDDKGRPLVVYHSTDADFDTFKQEYIKTGGGFWFTDNMEYAQQHGNRTLSVYLAINKPFDADVQDISKYTNNPENIINDKATQQKLIADGFDGIVFSSKGRNTYIVFDIYTQKFNKTTKSLQEIVNGAEEATVKDLRNDLTQYGGTNDITFIFGNKDKGLAHIVYRHGIDVLPKVIDAVIDGKITKGVLNKSVEIEKNGVRAILLLKEFDNVKTWLITGYDLSVKPDENGKFYSTPISTQNRPTFSRSDLGAVLTQFTMTQPYKNVNSQIKSTQNRGTFSKDTGNIYHQRTQSNGYYDAELKVIVLGRNMNTMTLPHEILDFYLCFCRLLIFFRVRFASENALLAELKLICASMINNIPKYAGATNKSWAAVWEYIDFICVVHKMLVPLPASVFCSGRIIRIYEPPIPMRRRQCRIV